MTSVAHSLRDLLARHLVRAYVGLWLFDRWLRQIWRHIRRPRHSNLLFGGATDAGLCLFREPGGVA